MCKLLTKITLIAFLLSISSVSAEHIKIGILAFQPKAETSIRWQPLALYLQKEIPQYSFEVIPYTHLDLEKAVQQQEIDFILTNPGHYIRLENKGLITTALMTLINKYNNTLLTSFGGVIFSLASNKNISILKDIKDKKIAATTEGALGGFQMQAFELHNLDITLSKKEILWTGMPHENVVLAVLNNKADVGFVRAGVLENMINKGILSFDQIKIINQKKLTKFPFFTSTSLYPEWPFSAVKGVDNKLIRLVVSKLLSLPHGSDITNAMSIQGFTISSDYAPIRTILKALRAEPYEKLPDIYWTYLQDDFGWYALSVIIAILIIIPLAIRLGVINNKLEITNNKLAIANIKDGLTGIGNRRYFDEEYVKEYNSAIRTHSAMTIMMIDIDFFKNFNDSYGHQHGDYALQNVAQTLAKSLHRNTDNVYRYGGEEFIVISIGTTETASKNLAEQLRQAIESLAIEHNDSVVNDSLTISIGVSTIVPQKDSKREALIKAADNALYIAKQKRNRVIIG